MQIHSVGGKKTQKNEWIKLRPSKTEGSESLNQHITETRELPPKFRIHKTKPKSWKGYWININSHVYYPPWESWEKKSSLSLLSVLPCLVPSHETTQSRRKLTQKKKKKSSTISRFLMSGGGQVAPRVACLTWRLITWLEYEATHRFQVIQHARELISDTGASCGSGEASLTGKDT